MSKEDCGRKERCCPPGAGILSGEIRRPSVQPRGRYAERYALPNVSELAEGHGRKVVEKSGRAGKYLDSVQLHLWLGWHLGGRLYSDIARRWNHLDRRG
jgi:hypothetical protein